MNLMRIGFDLPKFRGRKLCFLHCLPHSPRALKATESEFQMHHCLYQIRIPRIMRIIYRLTRGWRNKPAGTFNHEAISKYFYEYILCFEII